MGRWDFFDYTPSRPIPARGGIKAQSRHRAFEPDWWGKRWIAVLEGFHLGARLSRGKSYARHGQVLSVTVNQGVVTASVQGSRKTPYLVKIGLRTFTPTDWKRMAGLLAAQPFLVAKLLAGELPGELEQVFTGGLTSPCYLNATKNLKTSCSCPDSSNPCKHYAAVYYILGENFDQDPFLKISNSAARAARSCANCLAPLRQAVLIRRRQATFRDRAPPGRVQAAKRQESGDGIHRPQRPGRPEDKQSDPFEPGEQAEHSQPAEQAPLPADPGVFWKGTPDTGRSSRDFACFRDSRLLPPRKDTRRQRQPCSGGWAISLSGRGASTCSTCWNPSISRWRSPGWP